MMRTSPKILRSFLAFSLLFGTLFVPSRVVEAGFFSSLFGMGDQALADTSANTVTPPKPGNNDNLQNIPLLQVTDTQQNNPSDTNADNTKIVSDSALQSATGPLGMYDNTNSTDSTGDQTSVYVVRKGDNLASIAKMFGVSVNTILLANDMKKGDKLAEGDVLVVLPISGVEYVVKKGDTLKSVAKDKKVDINDIASYNGISVDAKLAIGDKITIPGADTMVDEGGSTPAPDLGSAPARDLNYYILHPLQNLIGYFIDPVPVGRKTQGLHGPGHRGIDIGAPTGSNIYASATGTVIATKTGCRVGQKRCGGGYGNMEIIEHPNGTKTLYAHMSSVDAHIGDQVAQGEVIGRVGNTGRSTGPHLHFEVFNAKNPGADWSWANSNISLLN